MPKPILIVEDKKIDADALTVMLSKAGVANTVIVISSGREAMDYLTGCGRFTDRALHPLPAILMLDLKLPDMDGFEVLGWLKANPVFDSMLVVVLTGYDGLRETRQAYLLGADSFLSKPCRVADLQELIKAFPGCWETGPAQTSAEKPNQTRP